jgi:hypothetical protein
MEEKFIGFRLTPETLLEVLDKAKELAEKGEGESLGELIEKATKEQIKKEKEGQNEGGRI